VREDGGDYERRERHLSRAVLERRDALLDSGGASRKGPEAAGRPDAARLERRGRLARLQPRQAAQAR
jgi:hypothetical protein